MSKTQNKLDKTKADHAEFIWTRIQVTPASMQAAHDEAVKTWEKYRSELTDEQNTEVQTQVDTRQNQIKEYLMAGHAEYVKTGTHNE